MTKPAEMTDRVFDLIASGVTEGLRIFHILKAEGWPEVVNSTPVAFYGWLRDRGFTVMGDGQVSL